MKIKALVIAPYPGLAELTSSMAGQFSDFDVTVVQADLMQAYESWKLYENAGFDLIISRGGTARLLRERSLLPVIEILVSGYDIIRMLTMLKDYRMKLEMIGFQSVIEGVVAINRLMDADIPHTVIRSESEVEQALEAAKAKGAAVIVGDTITIKLAKAKGFQGILITSGRESVAEAFRQAKQIHEAIRRYRSRSEVYAEAIDRLDTGLAIFDADGNMELTNRFLRHKLRLPPQEAEGERGGFARIPFAADLVRDLEAGGGAAAEMYDPVHKCSIACSVLEHEPRKRFLFTVKAADNADNDIVVVYPEQWIGSVPPLIMMNEEMRGTAAKAARTIADGRRLIVYGERGTGKRLFADAVHRLTGAVGKFVEVRLRHASDDVLTRLEPIVLAADRDALLLVKGIERMPGELQEQFAATAANAEAKLMFAFEADPASLVERGELEEKLFEAIRGEGDIVHMPPLRESIKDFDEYIRFLIAHYNEKYGKQIVGIRPHVREQLISFPWSGNLTELRRTMDSYIKQAQSEYVEDDILPMLERSQPIPEEGADGRVLVDIRRTLEDIQMDIIHRVLREENMNQSKAAKRLGINRSTLWRILKREQ